MKRVYMDYAATTPVDPKVLKAMQPYQSRKFGNTMSLHSFGQEAKEALEQSRRKLADLLNARSGKVIFTGSATEANNTALKGAAFANREKGKHIIISSIEHHCVLDSARWLQKQGFELTYLPVDNYGLVDPSTVSNAIRKDTILVSVMHANNEIGTIEPVGEIGRICRERGVGFHTDAAQSLGKIPVDVEEMNADLLTACAHKMYGPKGVGALFVRDGVRIEPLLHGGGHEFGLRSSTVNVAGIVGFGAAADAARREMGSESKRLTKLRDRLSEGVLGIDQAHLNGHPTLRLSTMANFWFAFIEGESLVAQLDMRNIAASTGSACSSESLEPSHVLIAIGLKHEEAHGSLRLSLGRWTTRQEVDYVVKVLPDAVQGLRVISPFKGRW
jgi:cysteine desulfurase